MVYASTRHECMGVHTSERAITFYIAVTSRSTHHAHTHSHMCIFGNTERRGQSAARSSEGRPGENANRKAEAPASLQSEGGGRKGAARARKGGRAGGRGDGGSETESGQTSGTRPWTCDARSEGHTRLNY